MITSEKRFFSNREKYASGNGSQEKKKVMQRERKSKKISSEFCKFGVLQFGVPNDSNAINHVNTGIMPPTK